MTYKEQWMKKHPGEIFSYNNCPVDENNLIVECPDGPSGPQLCYTCWDQEILEKAEETNIKDSGDRTQFETGAVRDMREGKGRCDLMPLRVVGNFICDSDDETDDILWNLHKFLDTSSTSYLYSALECFNQRCWDNAYTLCLEVAKHFEEGAKKYGENNWQKGIPAYCYIDSAIRHYLKWLRGDKDEPHDRAFCWNILCCIWEVDYHKTEEDK